MTFWLIVDMICCTSAYHQRDVQCNYMYIDQLLWLWVTMVVYRYAEGSISGLPGWASTTTVKPIWIYCRKRWWVAVASAGPYADLHLTQTDNHVRIPPLSFFTGRMPFLPPNQQHQSTEVNPDNRTTFVLVLPTHPSVWHPPTHTPHISPVRGRPEESQRMG